MTLRRSNRLPLGARAAMCLVGACAANAGPRVDADVGAIRTADVGTQSDAATAGDASRFVDAALDGPLDPPCLPDDPPPWWCIPPSATGPICGDQHFNPSCVDGVWACPVFGSFVPDRARECECFSGPRPMTQRCACTDGVLACTSPCGATLRCQIETEYCAVTASDVGGEPDSYACAPFLEPCDGFGCACVAVGSIACESDVNAVTARYPGG